LGGWGIVLTAITNKKTLGFISDHETKIDLLRNKAIATTIINIIGTDDPRPLTVGVHGYWGAGKSSVLEMIAAHEFENDATLVIRFNGWQFEGFADAKIALIEGIIDQLLANKTIYSKAKDQLFDLVKRVKWLKLAKTGGELVWNASTGLPAPSQISSLMNRENVEAIAEGAPNYLREAEDPQTVAKNIREFHAAFEELIEKAGLDRLIVLVDDLDRCLPETAIETLEAIRLFVMLPKTAFVIGADETMIRYAVTRHFPDLPEHAAQDYPRAYLEKLIQVPFRIPAMGEAETRTYLTLLVVGAMVGESGGPFNDLLEIAEDLMSSPWLQKSVGDAEVASALGSQYTDEIVSAVTLVHRIAPMLASGTSGNPRNVKRFMNSLTLRLAVANARGFGNAIDSQVLAKLMLVEQFATVVFEDIAKEVGSSPDGISASLAMLERDCVSPTSLVSSSPMETEDNSDDPNADPEQSSASVPPPSASLVARVATWLTLPHVASWAQQHPPIGELDLRPYLFVVNDVRNFALLGSALDPELLAIVEKLAQGGLSASSALPAFEALPHEDRAKVFDELRRTVLGSTSWSKRPLALEGMIFLVNKVPAFEGRYLELLFHLPAQKLGRWAEGGHDRAVQTEVGKRRFREILENWKTTGSEELKTAIRSRERRAD
jgi:hypothetical protein